MEKNRSDMELMGSLENILSTLRHEMGNPVNSLKITLDVLQKNYDLFGDVKRKDYLKRGSKLLARQERLVEAMKSYSKFDVKQQEEIPFFYFWKSFLTMAATKLKDGNIKFVHKHDLEPFLIKGSNMALNKVMVNILDNAMAAVDGVNDPKIELKAIRSNEFVMIRMKDNGCGIGSSDLSKTFIPLFTTKPGAMGMGLPIARKLLWKMEGRMEIQSQPAKGTEVSLWLKAINGKENDRQS